MQDAKGIIVTPSFGYLNRKIKEGGGTLVSEQHLGQKDTQILRSKVNQVIQGFDKNLVANKHNPVIREKLTSMIRDAVMQEGEKFPSLLRPALESLAEEIQDEILGFGVITKLLDDPEISEVMVLGRRVSLTEKIMVVYYEKDGRVYEADVVPPDEETVYSIIEKIGAPIGRRADESMPMMDARLPDGSRVNAIIPPLALDGPCLTIRKFKKAVDIEHLIHLYKAFTERDAEFMESCVRGRLNIVVSGGTGSGKTTTLNALSSFIPSDERIITIEDAAELQLKQPHVVRLETRPPNMEGKGAITIRDEVRNALRMRPDRIVVGEVRSGEALDMLQAMNTGHDGSLTTGHANSPRDMLARLETMVLMSGMDLPVRAIREQIASAVNLIIQQDRFRDGRRKITQLVAILGIEGDKIITQDLLSYSGRVDALVPAPGRSRFIPVLEKANIPVPSWMEEAI
ncbi:CpaF family protein [Desulforamulus ruminis]|uniref:Type II secretion system protein E n=1 Tax=Desulforamulus ruminis (strain ATCC 23193 / DSM 2154 / NCIMB 8452 / DL) TaxID=696281 RepID=F6DQ26_DESRL|nr:CpaF family protein [Desulforamulus ruminis]AEG61970.1 type II secretion system protein E [Desulforamulus ruminis DSM 2154]